MVMTIKPVKTVVVARTQFEGWHRWKDAPEKHLYLSYSHRHMFHVEVFVWVEDPNRGIEFIQLKHEVEEVCKRHLHSTQFEPMEYSCEQMAIIIGSALNDLFAYPVHFVKVFEDDENGGIAYFIPKEEENANS